MVNNMAYRIKSLANIDPIDPAVAELLFSLDDEEVTQKLLRNPSCPYEILTKAIEKDVSNYFYIIKNPKCPVDMLKEMAYNYGKPPYRFGLLSKIDILEDVVSNPNCPVELIDEIYDNNKDMRLFNTLVKVPKCPLHILKDLIAYDNYDLLIDIAKNPSSDEGVLRDVLVYPSLLGLVLQNPNCPPDILDKYVFEYPGLVCKNPNCLPDTLLKLYNQTYTYYMYDILSSSSFTPELLNSMFKYKIQNGKRVYSIKDDLFTSTIENVASSKTTQPFVLKSIFECCDKYDHRTLCNLAENPNTLFTILNELSKDDHITICCAVAKNPNCPGEILRDIMERMIKGNFKSDVWYEESGNKSLIENILSNPNCPSDVLEQFVDTEFSYLALKHPNCKIELLYDHPNSDFVVFNKNANKEILEMHLNTDNVSALYEMLSNPLMSEYHSLLFANYYYYINRFNQRVEIPLFVARELANSNEFEKKRFVLEFDKCPIEIIDKLSEDTDYRICAKVASHLHCPEHILAELSTHPSNLVKSRVARNNNTLPGTLLRLAKEDDEDIRTYVASNPHCPKEAIDLLLNDESLKVVAALLSSGKVSTAKKYKLLSNEKLSFLARRELNEFYIFLYDVCKVESIDNANNSLYYLFFISYCSIRNDRNNQSLTNEINRRIIDGYFSKDILLFITTLIDWPSYFSNEAVKKIFKEINSIQNEKSVKKDICDNINKAIKKKEDRKPSRVNFLVEDVSEAENNDPTYLTNELSNRSYAIEIELSRINNVESKVKDNIIEYGEFPQEMVSRNECELLEVLAKERALDKTGKVYIFNKGILKVKFDEYILNGRKFIRISPRTFIEVKPIKWIYNKEKNTLVSEKGLLTKKYNSRELKDIVHEIINSYSTELNETEEDQYKKINNFFEEKDERQNLAKKIEEKQYTRLEKFVKDCRLIEIKTGRRCEKKINILMSLLILDVGDHKEFNPRLIPYLRFINLEWVKCDNLKLSRIDFTGTNIVIDPQKAWNKDLSYSVFDNINLQFVDFEGCNLNGADISKEDESNLDVKFFSNSDTKFPANYRGDKYGK